MLVLRVRCVDDGRELLLERHGADEYSVQVAELKKLILQQRQQFYRSGDAINSTEPQPADLEDCFVLLRGQILADPDIVDLNALRPSDFFVFAPDASQSEDNSRDNGEMHKGQVDSATFEVLRSQLVDMGFSSELAAQALRQSGGNLLDAAALLAEGRVHAVSGNSELVKSEEVDPSIAPLRSVVHDENVGKLRESAAMDSFQASLLLKEQFSSETLNLLNENPVATLRLLSQPAPTTMKAEMENQFSEDIIDVEGDYKVESTGDSSNDAVDRLVAMGFARDLVEVMYESCGGDEQLTANALLQTLES